MRPSVPPEQSSVPPDSMCYMSACDLEHHLREAARHADDLHAESRRILVESARAGAAAGLSQRAIAAAMGRSQPEISRLLRFHGHTPLARALERNRRAILQRLSRSHAVNVRVFGSVSRGEDGPDSDVDLLVDFVQPPSLFELADLESELGALLGAPVEIVPAADLRENVAPHALAEAVPL